MKNKVLFLLFISLFSLEFFSCSKNGKTNLGELAILAGRAVRLINQDRVTLAGTVKGPGSIKNAKVHIFPTPTNGQCVNDDGSLNGTPTVTAISDNNGSYSVTYQKTGSSLCVVVVPSDGSQIEVFSPATRSNTSAAWAGKNNLMAIINEPTNSSIFSSANKTTNITPFTRMAARRFSALSALNPSSRSRVFLRVIPFSERAGNGSKVEFGNNTATTLLDKANEDIENAFFPKRDKNSFSLESSDPNNPSYALKLGSIGITADKLGGSAADGKTSAEDLEKVINFMEEDFSDGRFDGKKVDTATGKIAKLSSEDLGGVVASTTAADNFLKNEFKAAQQEYDSYDESFTGSSDDLLFCDTDSLDAACSIAVLPGSPPEIWIFDQNEEFIDLDGFYDHGMVGFGTGGTASTRYYTIVNGGGSDLTLSLPFTFSGSNFTLVENPEVTVAAGDATYFAVRFVPSAATSYEQTMTITSNDTLYSPYTVYLTGEGIDLGTNLALLWNFNGDTNDSSGNGIDALINSGANPTLDIFGIDDMAYNFDGSSYLRNNTGVDLSSTNEATFSVWVSPSDLSIGPYAALSQGGTDFEIAFTGSSSSIQLRANGDMIDLPIDEFDFVDSWNLITGVYNDSGDMILYINGTEFDRISITPSNFPAAATFTAGNNAGGSEGFEGDIDDVRVYSAALTPTQVAALYNQD